MAKITLSAPRQGIAQSPHIGYGDVRNMDIDSYEGIVRLNNLVAKKSGSTVDAQINWIVRDPITITNVFAIDSNGSVYNSSDSGATWAELSDRGGSGQGLAVWKDYLIVCEDTTIDVYGPLSGAPTWTDNWKTIDSDTDWHPLFISKNDGKLYGGAGQYVFSIEELTTFDPASSVTYTFTQQALDLPAPYKIKCVSELGNNLMLGTWQGSSVTDIRVADIYPWDRSSPSFGQPVQLDDYGVHALMNDGNSLIVLAGVDGIVYSSNGASAWPIGQLPQDLSGGKYLEFYPGALVKYKNKIFFGVGQGGSNAIAGMGVYSLRQTGKGNILNFEHTISTLNDGSTNPLKPSALLPMSRDTLLIGWRDNATYGIDLTTATAYNYSTDYSGYFVSPIFEMGNVDNKWDAKQIEIRLGKPLATGEGIQVSYRKSLSDSWVVIKTMAYGDNNVGSMITKVITTDVELNVKPNEQIQFKLALLGTATTTPDFKTMTIE